MMKNTWFLFTTSIVFLIVILSGCETIFSPIIYEPIPTKVRYEISYGYLVNCTGTGRYKITYQCNVPHALVGNTSYQLLNNNFYQTVTIGDNTFIQWDISETDEQTYKLGLRVQVESESYLVIDLEGENALTVKKIYEMYPEVVNQYTQLQANETTRFIDPYDPNITAIAETIQVNNETKNSFLLAKIVFAWLKKNIHYQTHLNGEGVQSAAVTLSNKLGDCDDLSFLYISLCRALGIPARFIRGYLLTNYDNGTAIATAHAWVEVFVGRSVTVNGWIPVECACCTTSIEADINQNFGVETAHHLRFFVDDGSNESLSSLLSGLSYITYGSSRVIDTKSFVEIQNFQEIESKKLVITKENTRYYD